MPISSCVAIIPATLIYWSSTIKASQVSVQAPLAVEGQKATGEHGHQGDANAAKSSADPQNACTLGVYYSVSQWTRWCVEEGGSKVK